MYPLTGKHWCCCCAQCDGCQACCCLANVQWRPRVPISLTQEWPVSVKPTVENGEAVGKAANLPEMKRRDTLAEEDINKFLASLPISLLEEQVWKVSSLLSLLQRFPLVLQMSVGLRIPIIASVHHSMSPACPSSHDSFVSAIHIVQGGPSTTTLILQIPCLVGTRPNQRGFPFHLHSCKQDVK